MQDDLFKNLRPVQVLGISGNVIPIDLSVDNDQIGQLKTADEFQTFIDNFLDRNVAAAAFGGYNERRNLYKRSDLFTGGDLERVIHIGLDIWAKAGTPVLAAADGVIHSFNFNAGVGNYGPTIILEHTIGKAIFYTLYGHLSVESIETIEIGNKVTAGEQIATLGDASVNGDYAPHLHFQIINDIEDYFGDYPGVCSREDLRFYLENCPDPNLLLNLK